MKKIYYLFIVNIFSLIFIISYSFTVKNNYDLYFSTNITIIAFIFGTRPEIIKLAPIIKILEKREDKIRIITIFTGQHEDISIDFLTLFNIVPTFKLKVMKYNQQLSFLTSSLLIKISEILNKFYPSLIIVQGDTTTAMAGALSAFYLNIPIAHVEAGLRTYKIDSPFPEEMNRQLISKISTYHFAATIFNVNNLKQECLSSSHIFLVGNTVIDSLNYILSTSKINYNFQGSYKNIILFTIHRRENKEFFIIFLKVILKVIKEFNDTLIIYPIHPNPNVMAAVSQVIPYSIYVNMINKQKIIDNKYEYLNRLRLVKPLPYNHIVYVMNISSIIVTDSGGIQEEAVSLGKKLLILRENTERYEAIFYGSAILVGRNEEYIYSNITCLLHNKKKCDIIKPSQWIYGNGHSGKKIVDILYKFYPFKTNSLSSDCSKMENIYDIIYVLTIWKRNNYIWQLKLLLNQQYSKHYQILIVLFQNGNHISIPDYTNYTYLYQNINIKYIHSDIDTGYFARFLVPLLFYAKITSYFFIIDDDIRWGNLYFDNMINLINKGYLATRNGRIIDKTGKYLSISLAKYKRSPILYDEYIEYDFGGHIWGGRIEWLKVLWNHPPPFYDTCEDIWISVVLRTYLRVKTATPKCINITKHTIGEICACDDYSNKHKSGIIGGITNNDNNYKTFRINHILQIIKMYNYTPIYSSLSDSIHIRKKYYISNENFTVVEDMILCKTWLG